ncbi:MAG: hypothetical protein LBO03_02945, partial [Acidaminococcales bacterium]|nr:hypothetical protein [Acidaminococcales bacterium]
MPTNLSTTVRSGERTVVDDAPDHDDQNSESDNPTAEKPSQDGRAREKDSGKGTERTSEFDAFWERYPRKVNKQGALKAWNAKKKQDVLDADRILAAAEAYAKAAICL